MSASLCVLFLLLSFFLPESPIWLMKKERHEEAEKTMIVLRGPRYLMMAELEDIQSVLNSQTGFGEKLKALKTRAVLMPVLMMLLMFVLQVSLAF